jgi:ArsR family transcriptional regulator
MNVTTDPAACCTPKTVQTASGAIAAALDGPAADAEFAAFAKAVAHPIRVRILRMLARKEARACSVIVDELPLAQSTISEHLRILKNAGLVRANEAGLRVSYCIVPAALTRFGTLLDVIAKSEEQER